MFRKIKKTLIETLTSYKKVNHIYNREWNDYKNSKVNLGQIQAHLNSSKRGLSSLSEVEFQVFSQFGDDGIIQYLVNNLPIQNKTFVEFGVENYRESNTRFLLVNNYWSGAVIDGSDNNIRQIKSEQLYSFYDLRAIASFITKENINDLLRSIDFHPEIGVLSVDIDGNDYWVWKAINVVQPSIVICEYNSLFGFEDAFTIPYEASFVRGRKLPFNFYGVSLKAAWLLAREKGYFFIGCNSAGNNAYFVQEKFRDVCPFKEIGLSEGYNLASFSETWDERGEPRRGVEKIKSIHGIDAIDVETMKTRKVDSEAIVQSLLKANKFNGIVNPSKS